MPTDSDCIPDGFHFVDDLDGGRLVKNEPIEFTSMPFEPQKLVSNEWKAEPGFACRACGDVARMHPDTNFIWGCLTCGITTAAVVAYFKRTESDR